MPTPSVGLAIMDALHAALQAASPEGVAIIRNRIRPLERSGPAEVILYTSPGFGDNPPERVGGTEIGPEARDRRTRAIMVEIRKRIPYDGDLSPEAATDSLYTWAVRTICGVDRLGGLIHREPAEQSVAWDYAETDRHLYALAAVEFELTYETLRGDPGTP